MDADLDEDSSFLSDKVQIVCQFKENLPNYGNTLCEKEEHSPQTGRSHKDAEET